MIERVTATPEALEMIERLRDKHGPIAFQSGGCGDGSAALCLTRAELLETEADLRVGVIGASPFFVDRELYERWGEPELVIDVEEGEAGGFSLERPEGVHFVTRSLQAAETR